MRKIYSWMLVLFFLGNFQVYATPPVNLQATNTNLSEITLSWVDFDNDFDTFQLERSVDTISWFVIASGIPKSAPNFIDKFSIFEGITYYYRVRTESKNGKNELSDVISIKSLKRIIPNPPSAVVATNNSANPLTQIDLTWLSPMTDNVTNIPTNLEISRSVNDTLHFIAIATNLFPDVIAYTDKGLLPKTKYIYRLKAANAQGFSSWSAYAEVITAGFPASPSNLIAKAAKDALNNSVIYLNWTDKSDNEWAFNVERSENDSLNFKEIGIVLPNTQSFTNIPLTENVTYYYRVRASNQYGYSGYTKITGVTSILTKIPNSPYFLNAKASAQQQVALSWSDDANNEDTFAIERSTDGKTFAKIGETLKNVVTYTDNNLADKTLYYYRVKAVNSLGTSEYTNASVTTLPAKQGLVMGNNVTIFQVYPNPTFNLVKISLPSSVGDEFVTLRVIDKNNFEVVKKVTKVTIAGEIELDFSDMPQGAYTITIQTDSSFLFKRIFKY